MNEKVLETEVDDELGSNKGSRLFQSLKTNPFAIA